MPNSSPDSLFQLVKSMTKAEKRYFRLYVGGQNQKADAKFIQLFNLLDKQEVYDEKDILKKATEIKSSQLPNVKAHLYRELLTCLRLLYSTRDPYTQIREQIDYARLLYNRGLYLQSLKVLERAKTLAQEDSHFILNLEILQFEKTIESHYITRSLQGRAQSLEVQTTQSLQIVSDVTNLSNLALRMYGWYLEKGFVRNEADKEAVKKFFKENLKGIQETQISVFGKLYYHQAHCWYYFILQDFTYYYRHAHKWVQLFSDYKNFASYDLVMYLKANHNLLSALFMLGKYDEFCEVLHVFEQDIETLSPDLNPNIRIQSFIYINIAKINRHFLDGTFSKGLELIPEIEKQLADYGEFIDNHRIMIFYYKIACLYFGSANYSKALQYLNQIISLKVGHLRSDIQCFARILHLICHFELKHDDILEYLIKSIYKFLLKMEYLDDIQREVLRFLRKSLSLYPSEMKPAFEELKQKLEILAENTFNRRSYSYLDMVSWLESKIENTPVEVITQRNFKKPSKLRKSPLSPEGGK
jgi:hypothetical protein